MKNVVRFTVFVTWFLLVALLALNLSGCVAMSSHVDELTENQAQTAKIVASLADLHADLAEELKSMQAQTARKTAIYAEQNAGVAIDLSNESSAVNVAPFANKAMTGDWIGLAGLAVTTLLGTGYGYQQQRKAKRFQMVAHDNAALVDEVAELEPVVARQVAKAKKKA
jgi:hypothetical protein